MKWLSLGGLVLLILIVMGLTRGPYSIAPQEVWSILWAGDDGSPRSAVIWQLRLPRLLVAILVGSALSSAGAAFQSLLRSPLADPYLLGTSAGASLGVAIGLTLGLTTPVQPLLAFVGALGAVALVFGLTRRQQVLLLEDFLLAGVMVSTALGSLVSLLMISMGQDLTRLLYFLLGNLAQSDWPQLMAASLPFLAGLGLLVWNAYPLTLLSLGEEFASPVGVDVEKVKSQVLISATLLTASAVAAAGLIGFVGLVVPHLCRLWVGPDLRRLLPLSLLWGAVFLLGSDQIARLGPQELPVGIITALIGAPWFLWQLQRLRKA